MGTFSGLDPEIHGIIPRFVQIFQQEASLDFGFKSSDICSGPICLKANILRQNARRNREGFLVTLLSADISRKSSQA